MRDIQKSKLLSLIVLTLLFLLNDIPLIYAHTYISWLLIDYSVRLLALFIIFYLIQQKISVSSEFGLIKIGIRQFILWSIVLSVTGVMIDQIGYKLLEKILPKFQIMPYLKVENTLIKVFDLTAGLLLVSVTEELIFRGYYFSVLRSYTKSPFIIISISSLMFGLIHWSLGLHGIIVAAMWGILPVISMLKTGSVFPAIIAHYVTDFISFSGIIPDRWFY